MTHKQAIGRAIKELNLALNHQAVAMLTLQEHGVLMHDEVERVRMETARVNTLLQSLAELLPDEPMPVIPRLCDDEDAGLVGVVAKTDRHN